MTEMKEYRFKINGKDYHAEVQGNGDGTVDVTLNGVQYCVELEKSSPAEVRSVREVAAARPITSSPAPSVKTAEPGAKIAGKGVTSPLPGVIIDIFVKEGQQVKAGERVAVLEAMKMENDILADRNGTIKTINVNKGDSVLEGATIITID